MDRYGRFTYASVGPGWLAGCCWSGVEEGVEEGEEGEEGLKLVGGSVFGRCARAQVLGDSRASPGSQIFEAKLANFKYQNPL